MEKLKINFKRKKATGEFTMLIGKDGDYFVSKIPSLNLSSFGDTEEEAKMFMKHALDDYFETMFEGTEENLFKDLTSVGFVRDKIFNKRLHHKELSSSFIDGNGLLQGFDDPTSVKHEKITL